MLPAVGIAEVLAVDVEPGLVIEVVGAVILTVDSLAPILSGILIDYRMAFWPKLQRF